MKQAIFHVSGVVKGTTAGFGEMPRRELVRDGARVNVWCGLMHDRVILLLGTDCEQHLIPTHAETVYTSQLPPETVRDHLFTAILWRITLIAQCLADGLAEEHQLPGLLGHQINPSAFFSYSVVWRMSTSSKTTFSSLKPAQVKLVLQQPITCSGICGHRSNTIWIFAVPPGVSRIKSA